MMNFVMKTVRRLLNLFVILQKDLWSLLLTEKKNNMDYEFYSKPSCYTFHELFHEECCVQSEFMQKVDEIRKSQWGAHICVGLCTGDDAVFRRT